MMKTILSARLLLLVLFACTKKEPLAVTSFTAFTGATIIDGNGGEPIKDGVLLMEDGRIVSIGPKESSTLPENTVIHDVTGKTIIPGLINAHGHVGEVKGIEGGHYSRENIIDNLAIYARYGVTAVVSLGGDGQEAESLRAVNDTTNVQRARLFIAGT
ncbi:MAG: amidohydrolase, partial [Cytophaga sp.]|nr:amidohydrolase [Cytophaga sp.]